MRQINASHRQHSSATPVLCGPGSKRMSSRLAEGTGGCVIDSQAVASLLS